MIISFNPSIFHSQDAEIQETIAEILILLMRTNIHFLDLKSINAIFYDRSGIYTFDLNMISEHHLNSKQRKNLKELLGKKSLTNITKLHKQHLVSIVVGTNASDQEIHPRDVCKIIKERSKIILENGINDWKFIQGICQKYSSGNVKRQSIYQLVDRAIKSDIIEPENGGGVGAIIKVTERWIDNDRYKNTFRYKLMTIFDSDREKSDELTRNKKQAEFFKGRSIDNAIDCNYESTDLIVWHVLYKRAIENYIPLNILFTSVASIAQAQKDSLYGKTCEELDFIKYEENSIGIGKMKIKEKFPEIFLAGFSYRDFEERCEHHKVFLTETNEFISEIEEILLKIAKIL
jgi:hypothetical protein